MEAHTSKLSSLSSAQQLEIVIKWQLVCQKFIIRTLISGGRLQVHVGELAEDVNKRDRRGGYNMCPIRYLDESQAASDDFISKT